MLESIREIIAHTILQKNDTESRIEEEIRTLKEKVREMELIGAEDMKLN